MRVRAFRFDARYLAAALPALCLVGLGAAHAQTDVLTNFQTSQQTSQQRKTQTSLASGLRTSQLAPLLQVAATRLEAASASAPVHATVWLTLANKPALDAAVAAMYTPGSPSYHQFQPPSALRAYAPSAAQRAAVLAELAAHHLQVMGSDVNGFSVRISGQIGDFEAAFHTTVERYQRKDGTVVQALATAPELGNGAAGLVRAVSGVAGAGMQSFLKVPVNPRTGAQIGMVPVAGAAGATAGSTGGASPAGAVYSSGCFYLPQTVTLQSLPGSAQAEAMYTGIVFGASPLNTERGTLAPCGYAPQDVYKFYGLNLVYDQGYTGAGQTIAIVDAYGSPTIQSDFALFNKEYGLTPATSANFQVIAPSPVPAGTVGWAEETTLDVEWAHAIAPDANIKLITAPSNSDSDLQAAVMYVLDNKLANIVSNSYGQGELTSDPQTITSWNEVCEMAAFEGVTLNFATGDDGDYSVVEGMQDVTLPATSPYATAVGGTTTGFSPADGSIVDMGWGTNLTLLGTSAGPSNPLTQYGFLYGAGGGASTAFAKPAYQAALPGTGRQTPDIAALGDPYTGVEVLFTSGGTQFYILVGGTSLATPIFSAEWALLSQRLGTLPGSVTPGSLGQAAPLLAEYANSGAIRDVQPASLQYAVQGGIATPTATTYYSPGAIMLPATSSSFASALYDDGEKDIYAISFGTDTSLNVTAGWDNVTGWGTLDMGGIFQSLGQQ
jgi:subtilase family serine protease